MRSTLPQPPTPAPSSKQIRSVALPDESHIAPLFENANLADAYAATIPGDGPYDIRALAEATLGHPDIWVRGLMSLRDAIMSRFGVKTSRQILDRRQDQGGEHIDFFPILWQSEREIVVGEDDRHLNFRTSLMLRRMPDQIDEELIIATAVHCHNRLGRVYLATIAPFHRLVIRSCLRKAVTTNSKAD